MSPHYIPIRALRMVCQLRATRAVPRQIPVVVSKPHPADHGTVIFL